MKQYKILVTCSAGFIRSHLVDSLLTLNHQVFGIDDLSDGYVENISRKAKKTFYKINLRNKRVTENITDLIKPQVIFHLAASAREGLSQFSFIEHTKNNYNAYLNLLIPAIKNQNTINIWN